MNISIAQLEEVVSSNLPKDTMRNVLCHTKYKLYNDVYKMFNYGVAWEPSSMVLNYMRNHIRVLIFLHELSHNIGD